MFARAALRKLPIKHIDFSTAFLNGTLKEKVFIEVPKGVTIPGVKKKKKKKKYTKACMG